MNLPANYLDCEQGSAIWFQARLGCVTASRAAAVIAKYKPAKDGKPKEGEMAVRRDYRVQVFCETLTKKVPSHYVSEWMEQGREREPGAIAAYELANRVDVRRVGFVLHPTIARCGASPDGLVGTDGLLEAKCPKLETHVKWMDAGVVPAEHIPQMDMQLACCPERLWVDFESFCPELPEPYDRFVVRMPRNDKRIAEMEYDTRQFLIEVDEMLGRWRERFGGPSVIEAKLRESIAQVRNGKPFNEELARELVP